MDAKPKLLVQVRTSSASNTTVTALSSSTSPGFVASSCSGLRLMEALRLRVKDIDFKYAQIIVRDGKGGKDRITVSRRSCRGKFVRLPVGKGVFVTLNFDSGAAGCCFISK